MDREEKLIGIEIKLKKLLDKHNMVSGLIEQVLSQCKKFGFIAVEEKIKEEVQEEIEQSSNKLQIKQEIQEKIDQNDEKLSCHQNSPIQNVEGFQQPEMEQNKVNFQEELLNNQIDYQSKEIQISIKNQQDDSEKDQAHNKQKLKKNSVNQQQEICIYCDKKFKSFINLVQHLYVKHDIKLTSQDLEPFQQKI